MPYLKWQRYHGSFSLGVQGVLGILNMSVMVLGMRLTSELVDK